MQVRDGRPVIGYGFNSNGRYAPSGLIRERFIPRLLSADPAALATDDGSNLDPHKIWSVMMTGEKPGGHGERSVAVGTLDMAVWDAVAKIAEQPLYRLLADRYRGGVRRTSGSSSTPRAATTSRARVCARCRTRCAATWIWVMRSSR